MKNIIAQIKGIHTTPGDDSSEVTSNRSNQMLTTDITLEDHKEPQEGQEDQDKEESFEQKVL